METPETPNEFMGAAAAGVVMDGSVSRRSGRVRKKSSKLLDFQSPDELDKKPKRAAKPPRTGSGSGMRGRPPTAHLKYLRRKTQDDLEDTVEDDSDLDGDGFEDNANISSNTFAGAGDSDDELDELVADLVEGVEAESLEHIDNQHESKVRQSLYMTEKANKRKMLKDGKVVTGKLERKDKGKARYTAYSLWAREFRKTSKFSKNQDLDFSNAARRLGELWANVSNKEKSAWRRKAKIQATKAKARDKAASHSIAVPSLSGATPSSNSSFFNRATTSRTKKLAAVQQNSPAPQSPTTPTTNRHAATAITALAVSATPTMKRKRNNSHSNAVMHQQHNNSSNHNNNVINVNMSTNSVYSAGNVSKSAHHPLSTHSIPSMTSHSTNATHNNTNSKRSSHLSNIEVVDAAAHLKLLGESLTIIGERLKEHEGQIAVSGSLSVLLDSLLCSLGPLLCLTTHIPGLEKKPQLSENLSNTLDNIAYVMPGL